MILAIALKASSSEAKLIATSKILKSKTIPFLPKRIILRYAGSLCVI